MQRHILEVKNLRTSFYTHQGEVEAVRGINYTLTKGEILGIVGESGSGKSVSLMSIMGLVPYPGKVIDGEVIFNNEDLLKKDDTEMNKIRGKEIAMIFQDPMSSLNPVYRIGNQIVETILIHNKMSKKQAKEKAIEMLELVGIPSPKDRINCYPHEFSGGMRQRVMIAMALACDPKLLIADEPTTALDVTIQAQILELMKDIQKKKNTSIILVTHDLGVVADLCENIMVMYGGILMEKGTVDEIFYKPSHPYTRGLLSSIPRVETGEKERLIPIKGNPPDLLNPAKGCPFVFRCDSAMKICTEALPESYEISKTQSCRCWLQDATIKKLLKEVGNG